jgi:hypothetical protein
MLIKSCGYTLMDLVLKEFEEKNHNLLVETISIIPTFSSMLLIMPTIYNA